MLRRRPLVQQLADIIFYFFTSILILAPLYLAYRLVNRDIRTSYTIEASASLFPPTLTPGYQEVIDLRLLVSCASREPQQQSVSSAPPSSSSSRLSTPLLPIRVHESSAPPIAAYTASTLPSYPATPANYWDLPAPTWNFEQHPSAGHTPAPLYIANWNSDDDTAVEQSEATSDAWTPTPVVTPHSEEAGNIEYDTNWAENVSICLRHHVLEEGHEHYPWEHYSEEDFFN